tara:strand:+ start:161 stop:319 length:159 start_codon:yes stop_codon:yes gene_type:complete
MSNENFKKLFEGAFENKQGTKVLTLNEAKFVKAYMTLNRTTNEQKNRQKNKD